MQKNSKVRLTVRRFFALCLLSTTIFGIITDISSGNIEDTLGGSIVGFFIVYLLWRKPKSIKDFFPMFVVGFILLSIFRTFGDQLIIDSNFVYHWKMFLFISKQISIYCILFAMVALGLQTNIKGMLTLGIKPLLIGFAASTTVGVISVVYLLNILPMM